MRIETAALTGASAGTRREITLYRYGACGAGRKVYLQAGLHADEMPGVLVLQHLMALLDEAEAQGQIAGEVLVVPAANPIGLSQWAFQRPLGRHEADSLHNFNRGYPELARLVGDRLEGVLTASGCCCLSRDIRRRRWRMDARSVTPTPATTTTAMTT